VKGSACVCVRCGVAFGSHVRVVKCSEGHARAAAEQSPSLDPAGMGSDATQATGRVVESQSVSIAHCERVARAGVLCVSCAFVPHVEDRWGMRADAYGETRTGNRKATPNAVNLVKSRLVKIRSASSAWLAARGLATG